MTTGVQTPSDLFLGDLINPVKHYCTNPIWGAAIRMFPRHEQLQLCSAWSKQQPFFSGQLRFPSPLSQHHWIPLWVNTWVRVRAFRKCAPRWAPVSMRVRASLCSTFKFERTCLLIHTDNTAFHLALLQVVWQSEDSSSHLFACQILKLPRIIYIYSTTYTRLLEKLQYVFFQIDPEFFSQKVPILMFPH